MQVQQQIQQAQQAEAEQAARERKQAEDAHMLALAQQEHERRMSQEADPMQTQVCGAFSDTNYWKRARDEYIQKGGDEKTWDESWQRAEADELERPKILEELEKMAKKPRMQ